MSELSGEAYSIFGSASNHAVPNRTDARCMWAKVHIERLEWISRCIITRFPIKDTFLVTQPSLFSWQHRDLHKSQ